MEIIYLKTNMELIKKTTSVIKITDRGILTVSDNSIDVEERSWDLKKESDWHKKELNAVSSTKEEFDSFYIQTVKYINELSVI